MAKEEGFNSSRRQREGAEEPGKQLTGRKSILSSSKMSIDGVLPESMISTCLLTLGDSGRSSVHVFGVLSSRTMFWCREEGLRLYAEVAPLGELFSKCSLTSENATGGSGHAIIVFSSRTTCWGWEDPTNDEASSDLLKLSQRSEEGLLVRPVKRESTLLRSRVFDERVLVLPSRMTCRS